MDAVLIIYTLAINHSLSFILLLITIVAASIAAKKLTAGGALTGAVIAILIFLGAGYTGVAMLFVFFSLGTAATIWKKKEKQMIKIQHDQSIRRDAGQVIANGAVAALMGALGYWVSGKAPLWNLMMATSLSSAMADTLSSELGMIYGKRFCNIISWKADAKGLDGVVSLEGTLIGVIGSAIIALIYALGFSWNVGFWIIILSGTIGNLFDSFLGALLERKHLLTNNGVNFLNTFIAAIVAGLIYLAC
ncbi:DUF92 domain-containing protein [Mucilaginibacter sp. BT774]|uniref:DUF92 domain-containing protein n=1 Tax=Mucilaginibacter sp. BT774 TaxID=3062276 RepID=UPI0026753B56|nr:DUF92 domain-containing protein [Mucilaginibacter sp. BT774]MDO3628805.1 DUF92 domain-containing protein [Mucilaginibacter sp. BT774]